MKKKSFKDEIKKRWKMILGMGVMLIALIVVIVALSNRMEPIDNDYFVSDDSKLVMSLNRAMANYETSDYEPEVTRIVYYLDGDKVSNVRVFFDYGSEAEAREANDNITMDGKNWATGRKLNGKYIIFDTKSEQKDGLTKEKVEENIESMRVAGGLVED